MADYLAVFMPPIDGSEWGVTFPDLDGCTSSGLTFEAARQNAIEALAGHIAAMAADGDKIPQPSLYDDVIAHEIWAEEVREGATIVPVPLRDQPAPKERINVMIDRGVLRRVDEAARAEGVSRSAFLERAAASQLHG